MKFFPLINKITLYSVWSFSLVLNECANAVYAKGLYTWSGSFLPKWIIVLCESVRLLHSWDPCCFHLSVCLGLGPTFRRDHSCIRSSPSLHLLSCGLPYPPPCTPPPSPLPSFTSSRCPPRPDTWALPGCPQHPSIPWQQELTFVNTYFKFSNTGSALVGGCFV